MPSFVKTKKDEDLWNKAKDIASDADIKKYPGRNKTQSFYAYTNSVYQKLKESSIFDDHELKILKLLRDNKESWFEDPKNMDYFLSLFEELTKDIQLESILQQTVKFGHVNVLKILIEDLKINPNLIKGFHQLFKLDIEKIKSIIKLMFENGFKDRDNSNSMFYHEIDDFIFFMILKESYEKSKDFLDFIDKYLTILLDEYQIWFLFITANRDLVKIIIERNPENIINLSGYLEKKGLDKKHEKHWNDLLEIAVKKNPLVFKHIKDSLVPDFLKKKYSNISLSKKFFRESNYPSLPKRKIKSDDHEKGNMTDFKTWFDKTNDPNLTRIKKNKYDTEKTKEGDITVWGAPSSFSYIRN